ncbi:hypothetical protein [Amycolatopsis marina]|uniref:hypothetical protein n=1 Tax=Amycolatopsis marina TaxID=490629 RepID=UPI0011606607|nr:hypothetical protein [Amycolatopsis marina]
MAVAMLAMAGAASSEAETSRNVAVLGHAEIDTHDPYSVFGFTVHAQGNGRSGKGVVWMSHHNDEQIAWMVARVDCVRTKGKVAVVTAVVSDAQDFPPARPGESIALAVRDNGSQDTLSFASREQATRCHTAQEPDHPITRGDFRILARPHNQPASGNSGHPS